MGVHLVIVGGTKLVHVLVEGFLLLRIPVSGGATDICYPETTREGRNDEGCPLGIWWRCLRRRTEVRERSEGFGNVVAEFDRRAEQVLALFRRDFH